MNTSILNKFIFIASLLVVFACTKISTENAMANATEIASVETETSMEQLSGEEINSDKPFAEHKLVLQLSNQARAADVLDVANNLITNYGGPEYIDIEIVTFNEGVRLLYKDSPHSARIASLVENGVRFSVCKNTIDSTERRTGKRPELSPHADMVQAGVARMIRLIENGYINIKP